jgi:hypothetical protein
MENHDLLQGLDCMLLLDIGVSSAASSVEHKLRMYKNKGLEVF